MESGKYYVIGAGNNFYESMTKEQILAAITQAVESHAISDVDTGFVTTVKEQNRNAPLALWVGTEAEYNAIQDKDYNTLYIKTDDSSVEQLQTSIESVAAADIERYQKFGATLFSGSNVAQGDTLDIPNAEQYSLFAVTVYSLTTTVTVFAGKNTQIGGTQIDGFGRSYIQNGSVPYMNAGVSLVYSSGNTWTARIVAMNYSSDSVPAFITKVVGIM